MGRYILPLLHGHGRAQLLFTAISFFLKMEYKLKMSWCFHHIVACRDSIVFHHRAEMLGFSVITDLSPGWAPAVEDDMEILLIHLFSPVFFNIYDKDPDGFPYHDDGFVPLFLAKLGVVLIVSLWTWAQKWPLNFVHWCLLCGGREHLFVTGKSKDVTLGIPEMPKYCTMSGFPYIWSSF